jgi:gallate decarboxylase subunit C
MSTVREPRSAMSNDFSAGLRGVLNALAGCGHPTLTVGTGLLPKVEVAHHYQTHFATSPASRRTGDEPCVLYEGVSGQMPVLLGLYGARCRNELLLHGSPGPAAARLSRKLSERLAPVPTRNAKCHQVKRVERLAALPVLTTTPNDAGPYLTSGLVCAVDSETGATNVSIHRMRVLDADRLTIWMLPGRDLDRLHQRALAAGRPLAVSINIGVPPAVYLTSAMSAPFIERGESELALAGAVQGRPVQTAKCKTNSALCIADSEIVIEGEITAETADEFADPVARWAMPEFLGYMGQGRAGLPVISVSGVWHREEPIYQAFLGPGKEQSELLALPTEAGMIARLNAAHDSELQILDAHYLAPGGGQLLLALRVRKLKEQADTMERLLRSIVQLHKLTKAVWVVDEDVDIHSPEDLIWASTTRFQPERDLYVRQGEPGFPLDPSQSAGYLPGGQVVTDKYLMDLTAPTALRDRFVRWTNYSD